MIRRSIAIAVAATVLSLMVHFLGVSFTFRLPPPPPGGDAVRDVVALGNAFEDVAETVAEPVEPEPAPEPELPEPEQAELPEPEQAEPPEPEQAETPEPEEAETPTSDAKVASANPQQTVTPDTGTARTVRPDSAGPVSPEEGRAPEPETVSPTGGDDGMVADASATPPVTPDTVAEAPKGLLDANTAAAAAPVSPTVAPAPEPTVMERLAALPSPAVPAIPVPVAPAPEPSAVPVVPLEQETVEPETPDAPVASSPDSPDTKEPVETPGGSELAVAVSPRPRLPENRPVEQPAGLPGGSADVSSLLTRPTQLMESPLIAYQRGRTDLTFQPSGGAPPGGSGSIDARAGGNSDTTNYAGRVLVHLNRAPTVPVSGRGYARVFFEISPDGSLAWVDVIDGSGTPEIDQAAKAQVRAAAPFPRPPQGAARKLIFVYRIN